MIVAWYLDAILITINQTCFRFGSFPGVFTSGCLPVCGHDSSGPAFMAETSDSWTLTCVHACPVRQSDRLGPQHVAALHPPTLRGFCRSPRETRRRVKFGLILLVQSWQRDRHPVARLWDRQQTRGCPTPTQNGSQLIAGQHNYKSDIKVKTELNVFKKKSQFIFPTNTFENQMTVK